MEWGTYAMYLYCEKRGIDLKGFAEEVSNLQFNIPVIVSLLQSAVKATKKPEPEFDEVCLWIDECGGLLAQSGPLHEFANYVISRTVLTTSDPVTQEKKSELSS
jgi:hypothetical protein